MKSGKNSRNARIFAAALLLVAACGSPPSILPHPLGESIVIVGVKPYPGFSEDNVGIRLGFEESAQRKIKDIIGIKKLTPTTVWPSNWESKLSNGEIHLAMGMISDNDARATKFRLARSYLKTDIGLLTLADAEQISSLDELGEGKSICTVAETSADATIKEHAKPGGPYSMQASTPDECINRVIAGTAYAYSTDRIILMAFAIDKKYINEDTGKSKLKVLNMPLGREQHISIALNKDSGEACRLLVDAIKKYVDSNDWLNDLKHHIIQPYLDMAPDDPKMLDEDVKGKFQPTAINSDRCG